MTFSKGQFCKTPTLLHESVPSRLKLVCVACPARVFIKATEPMSGCGVCGFVKMLRLRNSIHHGHHGLVWDMPMPQTVYPTIPKWQSCTKKRTMGEMILSFWCLEPIFARVTTISLRLTKNELSVRQSKVPNRRKAVLFVRRKCLDHGTTGAADDAG